MQKCDMHENLFPAGLDGLATMYRLHQYIDSGFVMVLPGSESGHLGNAK